MKVRFFSEKDEWTTDGMKITSPETLARVQRVLEDEAPIIVEHRFYRGASAPARMIFDDFEDFVEYLNSQCSAGDSIWIWNYGTTCADQSAFVQGKCPDDQGRVPQKGAY